MFTGIVEEVGTVARFVHGEGAALLEVACSVVNADAQVGASLAVDGVCLTVVAFDRGGFVADVVTETLERTTLARLVAGDAVNLERSLSVGDRFGGHLVQGHVDGVGQVTAREDRAGEVRLWVHPPADVSRYVAAKGSIAVSGVSLTVAEVDDGGTFAIALVPHTLEATTLGRIAAGERVNLEADIVAKYVERLMRQET